MSEIYIVWCEDMSEGVVFRNEADAESLRDGFGSSELAEAFYDMHQGETLTIDRVSLGPSLN